MLTFRWHHFITSLNILLVRDALPERPLFATYLLKGINASVYGQCDGKRILGWKAGRGIGGSAGTIYRVLIILVLELLFHNFLYLDYMTYVMTNHSKSTRRYRVWYLNFISKCYNSKRSLKNLGRNILSPPQHYSYIPCRVRTFELFWLLLFLIIYMFNCIGEF